MTRRRLLQTSFAAGLVHTFQPASAQSSPAHHGWLLLGNGGKGIYRARWNGETGEVGPLEMAAETPQPTYLVRHPKLPVVYACNEGGKPTDAVSAFLLDPARAALQPMATQPTLGAAPCYASVDRTGRLLFTANYGGGSLSVFPLDPQGRPGPSDTVFHCAGNTACGTGGPVKDRQSSPHLHCATSSPDGHFLLACDLGDDAILAFPLHPETKEPLGSPMRIPTAPGAGPRHVAFHPNGRWLYCINEINCMVSQYLWQTGAKQASAKPVKSATVSVLPAGAPQNPPSTGAEIALSRDGRFVYTSTRFCDVLTVFSVDQTHGKLTQIQQLPCAGKTPRFFALDPRERWLLCTNQDSDNVSVFARDSSSGQLSPHSSFPAPNPECLLWV